jgi:hypothetical protein
LRLGLTCVRAFETISKGIWDKVEVGIIDGVVHLLGTAGTVGMAALPLAEMGGVAVLPLMETTEVEEEGARLHAALGKLQYLDG